ncbi:MAG: hypothetical protein A2V66_10970 [Ignavibacteria bacterium RBG_13_36_8]|nr:MAG: hypothetical protein A2V66_10970 [Ignavibacteria bacterium RBG_13_36_8]
MKKLGIYLLLTFLSTGFIYSQEKLFTVEEAVIQSYSTLSPANLNQLEWIPNTYEYSFIEETDIGTVLIKNKIDSGKKITVTTIEELNKSLEKKEFDKLDSFPNIIWIDINHFTFWMGETLLLFDVNKKSLEIVNKVLEDTDNLTLSHSNKYVAFTKSNNLFLAMNADETKKITFDTNEDIVNGQSVHRNEFGINNGIFWSPNDNFIAFYHMDQSLVTNYPLVNIDPTPAEINNTKYPMAGQTSHEVKIGIYNLETENSIFLKTSEPKDQYLTNICWDQSEKFIYVAHLNRDQNHLQFIKYDAATGERVNILFEEKSNKYVEPMNPAFFLPNDPQKFVWLSFRDGWNHFYLYDTEGNLIKQITKGNWDVISFEGFNRKGEKLFFISNKDEIVGRHLYSIDLQSNLIAKLTREPGTHTILPCSNASLFIDNFNSLKIPRQINIVSDKGEITRVLLQADNPIKDYKIGNTKIFSIKDENNIDLYCRITTPPDFDSTRKYPVIVYVYGGPHSQGVVNSWPYGRYDFWFLLMAQNDYIVFELDNRGTRNRGIEFEQATFRRLGTIEVKDQMTGVNYLKSLEFVDSERFGVYGWSYGGFMATSLMLRTDGAFKVAVGGGTVVDWKYYEIMYTERYMDTPQTNPEGYEENSLLNYIQNLEGKLLLVNGTMDPTVVWQNSLAFIQKAVNLNKPLDYFPYVGHRHGVRGKDTIHLYTKITNYFLDNL